MKLPSIPHVTNDPSAMPTSPTGVSSQVVPQSRTGVTIAGALFMSALAVSVMLGITSDSTTAKAPASTKPKTATLQLDQATKADNSVKENVMNDKAQASSTTNTNNGTSIQTTVTNTNGESNAAVTVNGQPVTVPENGTTQQTETTANGTTTVTITGNRTTSGTSTNSSSNFTSLQVQSYSSGTQP